MPEGDYGCYWERNDSSGNIIDNNLTSGARMQVTISSKRQLVHLGAVRGGVAIGRVIVTRSGRRR